MSMGPGLNEASLKVEPLGIGGTWRGRRILNFEPACTLTARAVRDACA